MKISLSYLSAILVLWMTCCSSSDDVVNSNVGMEEEGMQETNEGVASVTEVSISGEENQYTFSITISSPDLGCQQYADWWEVIGLNGNLIYRRILAHSHVNEQPFTRSGGPVNISDNTEVYIRAHMNTTGYGAQVFKGSVTTGFTSDNLDNEFAKDLEEESPLPGDCAF